MPVPRKTMQLVTPVGTAKCEVHLKIGQAYLLTGKDSCHTSIIRLFEI